jgi:hypothetical protein
MRHRLLGKLERMSALRGIEWESTCLNSKVNHLRDYTAERLELWNKM